MKNKIWVAIVSMKLIILVLVFYFNYDGNNEIMSEGTLIKVGCEI
ncbi:hypothetical protein SAMN05661086_01880 [Anaeromicropila populeti]|uniref:Uncharacterized protein n=1 Tax=Anaeromicropila populeti TaxID=37658 RepID=A0A1I6JQN1_9FIRM|nr:hypothetical protein SAMN05661086_01880 [Anaeromicropila populeti]